MLNPIVLQTIVYMDFIQGYEMPGPPHPNSDPLSQVAKAKLLDAGEKPDPEQLYPLQLIRWGLRVGEIHPRPGLWHRQSDVLDALEGMDPQEALDLFTRPEEGCVNYDARELSKESPAEVSRELMQMLHSRMAATLDDYPLPRSD